MHGEVGDADVGVEERLNGALVAVGMALFGRSGGDTLELKKLERLVAATDADVNKAEALIVGERYWMAGWIQQTRSEQDLVEKGLAGCRKIRFILSCTSSEKVAAFVGCW